MLHNGPPVQTYQLGDSLQKLQVAVHNLQTSINQHQHLVNPKNSIDAFTLLKYAHKIAYTSFAPLNHEASQPLPPNVRPPNPQDWQFRSSQLHQFQAEWDAKQQKQQVQLLHPAQPEAPLQLPVDMKLPPMPPGWRPGMPIPGLEEMILAGASAETAVSSQPPVSAQRQQVPAAPSQPSAAASTTEEAKSQPVAQTAPAAEPTLRPAPFIPNFILNPGLEAVEEDYSSSDYSDEDM